MVDKLREVYESDPLAMASAYGVEPVTADETLDSAKAAGQFALESLPGIGTAMTVAEIEDELKSDNPNYFKIGMLAGSEAIGMIPSLGTVAKNMIRKGADAAKPAQEIVEVTSSIPKVTRRDADVLQAENLLDDPDALKAWQEENKLPETQRQANPEESQLAADALFEGEATSQETRRRIREAIPAPQEYTAEQVMEMMPTVTEVTGSLGKKAGKYGILGVKGFDLKEGQKVSSRLDIPAYNNYNTWVVSIHDGTKDAGLVEGFGQAVRLKNIEFKSNVGLPAIDIARGKRFVKATGEDAPKPQGKATIARIFGEYTSEDPYDLQRQAADIIASGSEEWTQVGMNPYRGSAFYDKKTGMPVFEADEVIQVGPLVLAKNVKKPTISQMKEMAVRTRDGKLRMFNEGGMAMDEQMNAVFKSSRTGYAVGGSVDLDSVPDNTVGTDPVSGNEIPLGSLPEEVRDDIPAQLSEGEYVVPADVVRYYGVKFFEDLRADAKFGYQDMEENGRIGGEPPMGMEMIEPEDDMMFDISELEVTEVPDEPEAAFFGKLFGKKEESSPEDSVRERFEAASKRDNSAKGVAKRQAERKSKRGGFSYSGDDSGSRSSSRSSSSRAKADFGFSGNPIERAERKYGNKSGSSAPAAGEVSRAYTPDQNEPTFAERINFGGNYAEGGEVDDGGRLGLGSEGIGLSSVSGGVMEVREYRNDAGHVMMIMFLDGEPLSAIPEGYYPVSDEPAAVVAPESSSGMVEAVSDGDGPEPTDAPEPINYKALTKKEMVEMLEEQQSMKGDVIAAGMGMVNPLLGGLVRFAMWDSSRRLEREIERRAKDPNMSDADRTDYEMMLEMSKQDKPNLLERIFKGKDTTKPLEEQTYTPETVAVDSQSVNDAVAEAMKYDPTAKTVLEDSEITTTELPDPVVPNNKAGEMPDVPAPYTPNVDAMRKTYTGMENIRPDVDFADPTMVPDAEPKDDNTQRLRAMRAGERASETVKAKRRAEGYRKAAEDSGSDDNLQLSIAELGRMAAPSDETLSPDYGDPRRGMMKKGGLASKRGKKKKK